MARALRADGARAGRIAPDCVRPSTGERQSPVRAQLNLNTDDASNTSSDSTELALSGRETERQRRESGGLTSRLQTAEDSAADALARSDQFLSELAHAQAELESLRAALAAQASRMTEQATAARAVEQVNAELRAALRQSDACAREAEHEAAVATARLGVIDAQLARAEQAAAEEKERADDAVARMRRRLDTAEAEHDAALRQVQVQHERAVYDSASARGDADATAHQLSRARAALAANNDLLVGLRALVDTQARELAAAAAELSMEQQRSRLALDDLRAAYERDRARFEATADSLRRLADTLSADRAAAEARARDAASLADQLSSDLAVARSRLLATEAVAAQAAADAQSSRSHALAAEAAVADAVAATVAERSRAEGAERAASRVASEADALRMRLVRVESDADEIRVTLADERAAAAAAALRADQRLAADTAALRSAMDAQTQRSERSERDLAARAAAAAAAAAQREAALEERVSAAEQQIQTRIAQLSESQRETDEARTATRAVQAQLTAAQRQCDALHGELADRERDLADARAGLAARAARVAELEGELSRVVSDAAEAQRAAEQRQMQYQRDMRALREELDRCSAQMHRSSALVESLSEQLRPLQIAHDELQQRAQAYQETAAMLPAAREEADRLRAQLAQRERDVNDLKSELDQALETQATLQHEHEAQAAAAGAQRMELLDQIESVRSAHAAVRQSHQTDLARLTVERDELEQALRRTEDREQAAAAAAQAHGETVDRVTVSLARAESSNSGLRERLEKLASEHERLRPAQLLAEVEAVRRSNATLARELAASREQATRLQVRKSLNDVCKV
jgi:chromosome segregation ATPase